jgi:cell division protein FtsZ
MMGTGEASGDNRALEAAQKAIANPLLDGVSMQGAKGVIISITGGDDMRLLEVDEAANHIRELVDPDANIIWGSAFNPDLEGRIRVSVVATGIEAVDRVAAPAAPTAAPAPFSFSGARRPDEPPSFRPSAETAPAPAARAEPAPAPEPETPTSDELVLGTDTIVPPPAAVEPAATPITPTPVEAPRRWVAPGSEAAPAAEQPAAPRVKLGGTLFERMSNAARGTAREEDKSGEPLDIPRFLHRQGNN